jgi:predicted  nucleic acid-binding Zn-ribbon protein
MATIHHVCDNCDSEFTIKYDVDKCEDDPHFCPFCSEYILENDTEDEDD